MIGGNGGKCRPVHESEEQAGKDLQSGTHREGQVGPYGAQIIGCTTTFPFFKRRKKQRGDLIDTRQWKQGCDHDCLEDLAAGREVHQGHHMQPRDVVDSTSIDSF
jgi:hypothetical protein